jgi:LAS superfamily LD-carboxypeptidase LdcB
VECFVNLSQVSGCDEGFLAVLGGSHRLHPDVVAAFLRLQQAADEAGFALRAVSCYRSFERQLAIWNAKATGVRPVLDNAGKPLQRDNCDDWQWVQAILRWSALPGSSRHHWGSDLDVYDAAAVAADFQVQLTPEEVRDGGPFCALHDWFDGRIAGDRAEGFFRPYSFDAGGVAPERWHLSFAPLAAECERILTPDALYAVLEQRSDFDLWPVVKQHWQEIYPRFVLAPDCAQARMATWGEGR